VRDVESSPAGTVHLIAICGAGMGAFAGLLKAAGYKVTGSDANVFPPMSTQLAAWGIPVSEGHRAENLDHDPDLVVVGNFCRRDNPECIAAIERGMPFMSFPQALAALFLADRHPVVVAGTHGKTTTTAWIAHLLTSAGLDPSALIGGIVPEFNGPFRLGHGSHFVVEGDEYDTAYFDKGPKFLHYRPQTAVLTSIEFDHADIYPDMASYEESFRQFVGLLPHAGTLVACSDDDRVKHIARSTRAELIWYGLGREANVRATELTFGEYGVEFTLVLDGIEYPHRFSSPLSGEHNVKNALAVVAVARSLGVELEKIRTGLPSFGGVVKRQEEIGESGGVLVIDDFAHHPTAVRETLRAVRSRHAGRRLWAIFEAKSNTARRKIFQHEFAEALRIADTVIIARPYAKKDKIPENERLHVERLVRDIGADGDTEAFSIPEVDDIVTFVAEHSESGDVVLVMSGSGFGGIQQKLLDALALRSE